MNSVLRLFVGLLTLAATSFPAWAEADPSARVGRIAVLDGPSLFRTDRQDTGTQASLNWPITSGAILDTERGSRAELWIGSTAYRLAGDSRVEFAVVDDRSVVLHQAAGTLTVTIRDRDQADDVEVRTPNGRVQFGAPGRYRIDVGSGRTNVATASGVAYAYGNDRTVNVDAGRTASIDPNGAVTLYSESLHDNFDDWVADRETATRPRVAQRYVSPAMTGYQDLDAYGTWSSASDYGTVWYPSAVPVGWAPYRYGRWAWVAPWGWTWIDDAPWGFAPFHYGRWIEVRGRWGWVPGAYAARPVYAPALVAWVGNPGWSVSLSIGSGPAVGWFPLAPREVYVPAYRVSPTYIRQVNVTHVTNVTVINRVMAEPRRADYHYRHSPKAVTVVPTNALREGAPIRASAWNGDRKALREAPVSAHAPSESWVAPITRHRVEGADGRRSHGTPTPVVTREVATPGRPAMGEPRPLPPGVDRLPGERRGERPVIDPRPAAPSTTTGEAVRSRDHSAPDRRPEPRPLPPGIDRLPPGGRSPATEVRPAPPASISPTQSGIGTPVPEPRIESRPPPVVPSERRREPPVQPVMPAERAPARVQETRPAVPPQPSAPAIEVPRTPVPVAPERRSEPQTVPVPRAETRVERPMSAVPEVHPREIPTPVPGSDRSWGGRPEPRQERPMPVQPREMPQVERRMPLPQPQAPAQPREMPQMERRGPPPQAPGQNPQREERREERREHRPGEGDRR